MNKYTQTYVIPIVGFLALGLGVGLTFARSGEAKHNRAVTPPACSACTIPATGAQVTTPLELTVFKIYAGTTYKFAGASPTDAVLSGSWSAEHGSIAPDGTYSPPNYRLPYGEDNLSFRTVAGDSGTIQVVVVPNPDLPVSQVAQWLARTGGRDRVTGAELFGHRFEDGRTAETRTLGDLESVGLGKLPIYLDRSETPPDVISLSDCVTYVLPQRVNRVQVPASVTFDLPSSAYSGPMDMVVTATCSVAQAMALPPAKCKKRKPVNGDLSGKPCSTLPNSYQKCGPVQITTDGPWMITTGQIKVTSQIEADQIWKLFNVKLAAGAEYPLTRKIRPLQWRKKCDQYKCVNGTLVYTGTYDCKSFGDMQYDSPEWCIYLDYGVTANPHYESSPWHCNFFQ